MDYFGKEKQNNNDYYLYNSEQVSSPSRTSDLYGASRTTFIRKVYTILSAQLLITTIMTLCSIKSQAYFQFQLSHPSLFILALVIALIIEIYIFCCNGARKFPQNVILTLLFTLCQGYIVSYIASMTGRTSGNEIVLLAAGITLVITVACSLYAIYSKSDYTTSSALLIVLSVALLILFIILLFTNSPVLHAIYCGLGAFLFGCYLVIDTQMIVGGRTLQLSLDEEYVGAMLLYIDIIMIFIYLLQLFRGSND